MNTKNEKFNAFNDIAEIKEFSQINEVNAHIKLGWKLIDTYKTTGSNQLQSIHYCLGLPRSLATRKMTSNTLATKTVASDNVLLNKPRDTSRNTPTSTPINTSDKTTKKHIYSF